MFQVQAQGTHNLSVADSITYQYYLKGDWEKLISTGKESIKQKVDFKWLRQRMGYAYFVKGDYYASQQQYEKALLFDKTDTLTLTYLYYCGMYTNNESFARFQASKLPFNIQKRIVIKPIRILDVIDAEYNYKINSDNSRSNPGYYRFGINSKLGYHLNLYQAFSNYTQRIDSMGIRQNEYFVLADYSLTPHLSLDIAYHYLSSNLIDTATYRINRKSKTTVIDSIFYPGHLFYSKLSFRKNRFDLALSGSILSYDSVLTQQYGIQAGVVLPGKLNMYLRSSLYGLISPYNHRLIFSQSVGVYLFNRFWAEGNITFGNLKNFSETNGLYIYNSDDETTFRTGLTLYWYVTKKMTLFGHYSNNRKEYVNTNNITTNYNQHSISTGIIWKI
jgi:hypothetical protein